MSNTDTTVTDTIISQLGGKGIFALAFARGYTTENSITLHFHKSLKARNKADRVSVTLCPDDTYTVQFMRYNRKHFDIVYLGETQGVYADNLKRVIESATGIYLSL